MGHTSHLWMLRYLYFLKVGQAIVFPHSGYFCSWAMLHLPVPWGTSLHPTPRASQACPCPGSYFLPERPLPPALTRTTPWNHIPDGSPGGIILPEP